jgi:ankyrin repeat protein
MTPLHLATRSGKLQCVQKILDANQRQKITQPDIWGRDVIHIAASRGYDEIAVLLLREHSQLDRTDDIGNTPLDYLLKDFPNIDQAVKTAGSPPPVDTSPSGSTSLADDYRNKRRQIFVEFARRKPGYSDERGKTFLHRAVEHLDIDTISTLINEGYDIEKRDSKGRTPLHSGITAARADIALWLLRKDKNFHADPLAKDNKKDTSLMLAAAGGLLDVVKALLHEKKVDDLTDSKQPDLANGEDVDSTLNGGKSFEPSGCNPLDVNSTGQTALHIALAQGHSSTALYLLTCGVLQENPKDKKGDSLLIAACMSDISAECVSELLERSKTLELWSNIIEDTDSLHGRTPLSWACEKSSKGVVKALLSNIDWEEKFYALNGRATGWPNYNPLHFAAKRLDSSVLEVLLESDAVLPSTLDSREPSPLSLAADAERPRPVNVKLLLLHELMESRRMYWLRTFCQHGYHELQSIVAEVMDSVTPDLMDEDIISMINESEDLYDPEPYTAFVEWTFKYDRWHELRYPYHCAARIGRLDLMESHLATAPNPPGELDDDNWSWVDYASVCSHVRPTGDLKSLFRSQVGVTYTRPAHKAPYELLLETHEGNIMISPCSMSEHGNCNGVQGE